MGIEFKTVTWYSQVLAIILAVLIFVIGFYFGSAASEQSVVASTFNNLFAPERPVTFYKPIEYLPAQIQNGSITSQAELDALYSSRYNDEQVEPGARFKKPGVNFEEYFILYQQIAGSGCYTALTPTIMERGNSTLIFTSHMYQEGTCEMALTGVDWAVLPRNYIDHTVQFKTVTEQK